jgi:diguanylate cyclase (GGDEF)-like protein
MRVLLVEDDVSIRSLVEEVLSQRGHTVAAFGDAEEAWKASQRESFPLNVLDWMLPGMDGLELCRRLRSLPDGDTRVVLCLTARTDPVDLSEVLRAGANDYLAKPFDIVALETRLAIAESQVAQLAERKRLEEALAHRALHDPLTGLANRVLLFDRLAHALRAVQRERQPLALLVLDLDGFKQVNDTFGHQVGDRVLQRVAAELKGALRAVDTVARLGGDEFAVVLPGADSKGASQVAEKLLQALAKAGHQGTFSFALGASIGIAIAPEHGREADTLLQHADTAMYAAKRTHSGLALYMDERDRDGDDVAQRLDSKGSLERRQFTVEYEPRRSLSGGQHLRVEARLVRTQPAEGGEGVEQATSRFQHARPAQSHVWWLLEHAVEQVGRWLQGDVDIGLVVEIPIDALAAPGFGQRLLELLRRNGVAPTRLTVEIDHRAVSDGVLAAEGITRLRSAGVGVSLSHFGSGPAELAALKSLPISELVLDRSIVSDLATDARNAAIVGGATKLGHGLGLQITAAGVDDAAIWERARGIGCDWAQGAFVGTPLSAVELPRSFR